MALVSYKYIHFASRYPPATQSRGSSVRVGTILGGSEEGGSEERGARGMGGASRTSGGVCVCGVWGGGGGASGGWGG